MSRSDEVGLIKCVQHGKLKKLPWSIICKHLMDDPTLEWIPIINPDGSPNDWICPECDNNWEHIISEKPEYIAKLRPACVECIDNIRRVFDKHYEKTEHEKEKQKEEEED